MEESKQYSLICKDEFAELKGMIQRIDECLRGDGEGLVTRVAKNELKHRLLIWITCAELGLIGTIVGKLLYDYFSK